MNVMTIDLEDWYHCLDENPANWQKYEDRVVFAVCQLLQILKNTGTRATFFVLGHIAESHPDLVLEIHRAGHEIASHGYDHRFVYQQSPAEFEADVRRSISLLASIIDQPICGYRAPYFSITKESLWALPILHKLGLVYDSSIFPVLNHRYGIPGAPRVPHKTNEGLIELPPSTYPLARMNVPCGGGAYFRFLPYGLVRKLFRRLNDRGEVIVFYLHPWELDAQQPRLPLPAALRFRHYWGLDKTAEKLSRLLRDFRFGSVKEIPIL